jgi:DNA-binding NtrC family response regulator
MARGGLETRAPLAGARVLVVDEDLDQREDLIAALHEVGCTVEAARPGRIERALAGGGWDALLADADTVARPGLLERLEESDAPSLLVLAGFGSIHEAVEAMRAGAADYLAEPISEERLLVALERALASRALRAENRRLRSEIGERFELGRLESRDAKMLALFETVEAIADTRATILIEGESGTGKTLLARTIHARSARAAGPFVEVNCGALPSSLLETELFGCARGAFTGAVRDRAGKFEAAQGGTILLDEIGCASPELQMKLLRVLQERELERVGELRTRRVDVRVIAATNEDLERAVAEGRFREDLFYRIQVVRLRVPPLRERPADVLLLAERFLARLGEDHGRPKDGFHPDCVPILTGHPFPGNVRELENGVERAVLLAKGPLVRPEDLPWTPAVRGPLPARASGPEPTLREALEECEREILLAALRRHGGRRKETADSLGVNRTTLFNKLRKFNLSHHSFDEGAAG